MCNIFLEKPEQKHKREAILFVNEFKKNKEHINGSGYLDKYYNDYNSWLKLIDKYEHKQTCPKNISPGYTYFLLKKTSKKIIGIINIRTACKNKYVYLHGGNIGYSIRPTERKKGYGKKILKLGLDKCKKIGMNSVTIIASEDNYASRKIIEFNNGQLINIIPNLEKKGHKDLRYRITLK